MKSKDDTKCTAILDIRPCLYQSVSNWMFGPTEFHLMMFPNEELHGSGFRFANI